MTDCFIEKISVLISSHNYGRFVCEAIYSVLHQTCSPDEIIVIDDGSTDGSVTRIETEFKDESSVQIIRRPNRGQLSALNAGYGLSTGDLVFFLDADDMYKRKYIESALDLYRRNADCDFLYCGWEKFGKLSEVVLERPRDWDFGFSVVESLMNGHWRGGPTSSLSIRRAVLEKFMPLDLEADWKTRADDCLVWGAAIAGAHKFYMAGSHIRYRVHDDNAWYGQTFSRNYEIARRFKLNRLVGTVAKRCGYFVPGLFERLIEEFESAGSGRDARDYNHYRKIISRSGRGFLWRFEQQRRLLQSYLRMWFRVRNR